MNPLLVATTGGTPQVLLNVNFAPMDDGTVGGPRCAFLRLHTNDTGVSDIAMDPQSPDILYAAAYERRRSPYGFNGGGPDSAIYKTIDGGDTWSVNTIRSQVRRWSLHFVDSRQGSFVDNNGHLYSSTDGGSGDTALSRALS